AVARSNRGLAHFDEGNLDLALKDLNEAVRLSPRDYQAWLTRARTHQIMENIDSAIDDFTKAIELAPNSFDGHYNRGLLYMKRGSNSEAAIDFQWILKNSPIQQDKEEAMALLSKLGIKKVAAR